MNKLISFIIPVYNGEKFIKKCLHSIINLAVPKSIYEIIVINDGSTDNTAKILNQIKSESPESDIRIINQENQGQSVGRNRGIEEAKGEFIWFVDADDFLITSEASNLIEYLKVHSKEIEIITFNYIKTQCDSEIEKEISCNLNKSQTEQHEISGEDFLMSHSFVHAVWAYLFNRQFLIESNIRFEPGKLMEDSPFMAKVLLRTKVVNKVDFKAYAYVKWPTSSTNSKKLTEMRKLWEGYKYSACAFRDLSDKTSGKLKEFFLQRSEQLTFFLFLKLMLSGTPAEIRHILKWAKRENLYPIHSIPSKSSRKAIIKYKILKFIINNPFLLKIVNRVFLIKR